MTRAKAENSPQRNGLLASVLLVGILSGGGSACLAAPNDGKSVAKMDLPADLDLVPRDAAAFVHLRAADLWRSEWAKDLRYLVDKAGPESWRAFEKKSPLSPSTLERITLILLTPQAVSEPFPTVDPEAMSALVVVTTNKPYDRRTLIQAIGLREKVYRSHLYYFNEELWSGLVLVDEHTFLVGSEEALVRFFEMSRQTNRSGPLATALAAATQKHQVVVGLSPTLFGKDKGAQFMPPPMQKLLGARCGTLTLDLDQGINLDVRLDFQGEDQAREVEKAVRDTLDLGRQGLSQPIAELEKTLQNADKSSPADLPENFGALVALGFLRELDSLLKEAPVQRQDAVVQLPLKYRKLQSANLLFVTSFFGVFALGRSAMATFDFAATKVGSGTAKDPIEEHLKNLEQALDKYHEKHGSYPPPVLCDREGRPVLSWRVALLPYLGEEALYREFKLDEPWDSLHNKRLLKKLPKSLQSPNQRGWGAGRWKTATQVFAGENTVFERKKGVRKTDVAKQAILLAHVANDAAVYWTKPADLAYAADKPLPNLFGKHGGMIEVLLTDGAYRKVERVTDEKAIRGLIERSADKPRKEGRPQQTSDANAIWDDLSQNDDAGTKKAWQGIAAMIQAPQRTVAFLKDQVKPAPRPDLKRIDQWVADLDSNNFQTREKAMKELDGLGELALPALDKKLADKGLSLEARRRLEELTQKAKTVLSGEELRNIRAIEILEGIGTPEAAALLDRLAHGGDGAILTEQAKSALKRLTQRSASK